MFRADQSNKIPDLWQEWALWGDQAKSSWGKHGLREAAHGSYIGSLRGSLHRGARARSGKDEGQGGKVVDCAQQSLLEGECGSDPRGPDIAEQGQEATQAAQAQQLKGRRQTFFARLTWTAKPWFRLQFSSKSVETGISKFPQYLCRKLTHSQGWKCDVKDLIIPA